MTYDLVKDLRRVRTDARGEHVFEGLVPGVHRVEVQDRRDYSRIVQREITVARGEEVLAEFELPESRRKMAASGRVVDEEEQPLPGVYLSFELDGADPPVWGQRTNAEGRFEIWTVPAASLTVVPGAELGADRFEPERVSVPFGTADLEFRRVARSAPRQVSFVVRTSTSEPIEGAEIWIVDRALGEELRIGRTGPDGSALVAIEPDRGRQWGVWAPGFLDAQGAVAEIDFASEAPLVEVRLSAGEDRALRVVGALESRPIAQATIRDAASGARIALTDDEGRARLAAPVPDRIEVSAPGHETLVWPTRRRNGWSETRVPLLELEPARSSDG
jgi:hypothetical protein